MKKFTASKMVAQFAEIGALTVALGRAAFAQTQITTGTTSAAPSGAPQDLFGPNGSFHTISNTLIIVVGAVSVVMLIVGGLRYVLSAGNSSAVEGAKNTILYAIIGIIVAILAYAIVNFVVGKFNT